MLTTSIIILILTAAVLRMHLGKGHPAPLFVIGWAVLLFFHSALPINWSPLDTVSLIVVLVGATSFALGASSLRGQRPAGGRPDDRKARPSHLRFIVASAAVSALVLYGLMSFEHHLAALAGSASYSDLTFSEARYTMSSREGRQGGLGTLLFTLTPLLACLGEYGGRRYSRLYYGLTVAAIWMSAQSPGRTLTLQVLVCLAVFTYYDRRNEEGARAPRPKLSRRMKAGITLGIAGVAAVIYFNSIGQALHKNDIYQVGLDHGWVPSSLVTPITYQEGGLSALAVASSQGFDPTQGNHGRSVYLLARVAKAVGAREVTPDTVAENVDIPIPFNVYTGFGDLWFDFGYLGLAVAMFFTGALASVWHSRAIVGNYKTIWLATVLWGVLSSTTVSFRLLTVETAALAVVGYACVWWLTREPQTPSSYSRDPQGARLNAER